MIGKILPSLEGLHWSLYSNAVVSPFLLPLQEQCTEVGANFRQQRDSAYNASPSPGLFWRCRFVSQNIPIETLLKANRIERFSGLLFSILSAPVSFLCNFVVIQANTPERTFAAVVSILSRWMLFRVANFQNFLNLLSDVLLLTLDCPYSVYLPDRNRSTQ